MPGCVCGCIGLVGWWVHMQGASLPLVDDYILTSLLNGFKDQQGLVLVLGGGSVLDLDRIG